MNVHSLNSQNARIIYSMDFCINKYFVWYRLRYIVVRRGLQAKPVLAGYIDSQWKESMRSSAM